MDNLDEEILKARKQIKKAEEIRHSKENIEKELEGSIFDGTVFLYGEEVEFVAREVEEYGISMLMPATNIELDDELKKAIYPTENRPKYVFGNESVPLTVSFKLTEQKVPEEHMEEFLAYSERLLLSVGPKVMFFQKRVEEKDEYHMGVIEFVSGGMDTNIYNIQFFLPTPEGLLIGAMNFPMRNKDRMMKLAHEMLDSVRIEKEEEEWK